MCGLEGGQRVRNASRVNRPQAMRLGTGWSAEPHLEMWGTPTFDCEMTLMQGPIVCSSLRGVYPFTCAPTSVILLSHL